MSGNTSNEVFEYTGKNGQSVPKNVVSVRFHPSVVKTEDRVFQFHFKLKEVVLNEGLQKIDKKSFDNCTSLERITLPSTVTDIGEDAFYYCNSLREVVLNEGLVNVGENAFNNCTSLTSITLPSTVTNIDENAFTFCRSLKKVVLNEGLKTIGDNAFNNCRTLESITIPSSLVEIGKYGFYNCSSLREVVLNEGLQKIDKKSFGWCKSLESIALPSTVTDIGVEAFYNCIGLREVVCSGGLAMIYYNAFYNCSVLERITFPDLSTRLDNMIRAGQVDIQEKVQQCINQIEMIEWRRGGTIYIPVDVTRRRDGWALVKQHFHQIVKWIKYYEMKEATTLIELAFWKANIDQVGNTDPRDRDACRVDVPGPVKDAIIQYL